MTTYTEAVHSGEFLLSEAPGDRSREQVTLAITASAIAAGTVMGQVHTAVAAADAGNTGDGTISAVTIGENVQAGVYTLTCTAAAVDSGTFSVHAPDGSRLADLTVAVAYAGHIGLTVADGAADWIVGDIITVTVTAGNYAVYSAAATDGTQRAAGILYNPAPISAATQTGVIIARDAEVDADLLTGSDAAALVDLAARGIIVR